MTNTHDALLIEHGIDPEANELFARRAGMQYGSEEYFTAAIDAGYYGVDDSESIAFRPLD